MAEYFIARKPILDRNKSIFGYEVLFRGTGNGDVLHRPGEGPMRAALVDPSLAAFIGNKTGFLKFNPEVVRDDAIERIPPGNTVVEVADTPSLGSDVLAAYQRLRELGYRLCLEASSGPDAISPLVEMVGFVKLDVRNGRDTLGKTVQHLKKLPVTLIGAGVDGKEAFDVCHALGFSLFQGEFFARPAMIGKKSVSTSQALLMELSTLVARNDDLEKIESVFRRNPDLTLGLLKLMNSAFFRVPQKVTSIRHAIALLGYDNLQKWVAVLLFSIDRQDPSANPLLEKVLLRGRIMELLAAKGAHGAVEPESAFMTGILSLVHVLFGLPLREVIEKLNVIPEIQGALLRREGFLGTLLDVTEKLDDDNLGEAGQLVSGLGLRLDDLFAAETGAILEYQKWMADA